MRYWTIRCILALIITLLIICAHAYSPSLTGSVDTLQRAYEIKELAIQRESVQYKLQLFFRALYLLILFLPAISTSGIAFFSKKFCVHVWYPLIRIAIGLSGAAFIKWGQWASTRADIFPGELCSQLSLLQANAPIHSSDFSKRQIIEEFKLPNRNVHDYFSSFEDKPVASGSIAQVHKAFLENGREVAVKVRHPNVEEQILMDFDIMKIIVKVVEDVFQVHFLKLSESIQQFSHTIAAQTDLEVEGQHLQKFQEYFHRWKDVTFPQLVKESNSVLVESYIHGERVSSIIDKLYDKNDPNQIQTSVNTNDVQTPSNRACNLYLNHLELLHFIVTRGEDLYLKMLLQDNFMHADLHPGNILVGFEGNRGIDLDHLCSGSQIDLAERYRISLVDAGMVAELTGAEQNYFVGFMESLGEGNGRDAAKNVLHFSSTPVSPEVARAFTEDMIELFRRVARGYGTNINVGIVLKGVLSLIRDHRLTVEANYATLIMNALCLDGMAQDLLPEYNVMDAAAPFFRLNRLLRFLPPTIAPVIRKVGFPFVRWIKQRADKKFLRQLQAKSAEQLRETYQRKKNR